MVKKREIKITSSSQENPSADNELLEQQSGVSTSVPNPTTDWFNVSVSFKNKNFKRTERFQHSVVISGKKRQWKALKQILAQEVCETTTKESTTSTTTSNSQSATSASLLRPVPAPITGPLYGSIDAPPSFRPAKKYSDISGLETHYTDPHTKLNFANTAEYKIIKKLPSDLVAGYLTLRRANTQLQ